MLDKPTTNSLREKNLIEIARVGIFMLVLILALISHLGQRNFIDWQLLRAFYTYVMIGLALHSVELLSSHEFFSSKKWLVISYIADVLLVSGLFYQTELQESLYLFMYFSVVLMAAISLGQRLGLTLAFCASLAYSLVVLLGPELKSTHLFFLLIINNVGFFSMAWIGGRLGEDLSLLDEELHAQSLSLSHVREIQELIVETIPSGILTTTQNREILTANPGIRAIFGATEILGRSVSSLHQELNDLQPGQTKEFWIKTDHPVEGGVGRPQSLIRVSCRTQSKETLGEPVMLWIFEDLTEIRKMELGLRQSEKMAAIGQLASGIAHEIRNPLAGISGSVELLGPTLTPEEDKKLRTIILREIDRLNHLISEFLDFAKPEKEPTDKVNLKQVLDETMSLLGNRKDETQLDIKIPESFPVRGDMSKLKQAFLNIVINGIQAMQGSAQKTLHISVSRPSPQWTEVQIQDHGNGMSPQTIQRIFEPFMTTKPKGTGLGLAITHKILELHRANVNVQSELGKGTTFIIQFPT